ncbi:uncharacterized protein [Lolium perenne]|uniref:uncharacterized protein isoform X2 n=1 Tax=Lolium perenne TaxID=4522 RepID=UPI0021F69447|nr:uncharacterized protein LOC127301737 isoform X2 [Lolium perenne]
MRSSGASGNTSTTLGHSTPLLPQIQPMEEGAGMPPRRSASLHPQIQLSEQGAGVTCRRSPCIHPQIQASEEGAGVSRPRSGGTSSVAPESPTFDDDMLREILIRLPPQPSSLPRASAVCRRWRGLVADPKFLCSFRARHRKSPLLGFFDKRGSRIVFTPILDPPDRVPPARLSLGRCSSTDDYDVLNCRHGLVLVKNRSRTEVVVCDPVTGEQRRLAVPPEFKTVFFNGAVLCTAAGQGHVHGGCHSGPFKVVLMSMYRDVNRPTVRVYSSETGWWGNLISTQASYQLGGDADNPAVLLGHALYWLSRRDGIVEFDLDGQSLAVITGPPVTNNILGQNHSIILAEDGALGFVVLSFPCFHMWRRNINGHGVATWVPWRTIEMHTILGLPSQLDAGWKWLMGYDQDNDVVFLLVGYSVYMVQLKSMQPRKLYETKYITQCHPFTSFYTQGEVRAAAVVGCH